MKILKINLDKISPEEIQVILSYLNSGKVIAYPSDTVYGLGCRADNLKAIKKVYKIKNRDENMPVLVLVKSYCMLKKYAKVTPQQDKYLKQEVWAEKNRNKPITVKIKAKGLLPKGYIEKEGELAVRMPIKNVGLPKNDFLIKIIKEIDVPLVSTSLNVAGQKPINDLKNLEKYFKKNKLDLVVDIGIEKTKKSSKIIDITDIKNIKIIRK